MCRLFGCRSEVPGGVAHELLRGQNALRVQSKEHPDGWGLGWYVEGQPQVVRSLAPAHADEAFEEASAFLESETVIAHVRKASVGRIALENTHPFQRGRWLFMHNGTLPDWERTAPLVEAALEPSLRRELRGETDSERCLLLYLSHLARRGDLEEAGFLAAAGALADTVDEVRRLCEVSAGPAASTTFLVTDGRQMLACRRGRTLHASAPPPGPDGRVHWFALSSEDPGGQPASAAGERGPWKPVPEDSLVGVDAALRVHQLTLVEALHLDR